MILQNIKLNKLPNKYINPKSQWLSVFWIYLKAFTDDSRNKLSLSDLAWQLKQIAVQFSMFVHFNEGPLQLNQDNDKVVLEVKEKQKKTSDQTKPFSEQIMILGGDMW